MRASIACTWLLLAGGVIAEPAEACAWPAEAKGYGQTVEVAKNEAVKHLVQEITDYLRQLDPPLSAWQPTADYVKRYVLQGAGKEGPDVVEDIGKFKSWVYPVRPFDLQMLTALNDESRRTVRQAERLRMARFAFAGAALLLACVGGVSLARRTGFLFAARRLH